MKRFFKYLTIAFIALIVLTIIANFPPDGNQTNLNNKEPLDSITIAKQQQIADSLAILKEEMRKKSEAKLKTFKKKSDEFNGLSFYQDQRAPNYTNINFIYPYICQKDDNYWLRLVLQYTDENWLFINKAIFLIDGEKYSITGNWKRDNNTDIWEWLDKRVETNEKEILEKIANSSSAKVRYEGSQYYKDRVLTSKEKDIIKKTLEIYNGL